jgi:hypothetical protein
MIHPRREKTYPQECRLTVLGLCVQENHEEDKYAVHNPRIVFAISNKRSDG